VIRYLLSAAKEVMREWKLRRWKRQRIRQIQLPF